MKIKNLRIDFVFYNPESKLFHIYQLSNEAQDIGD